MAQGVRMCKYNIKFDDCESRHLLRENARRHYQLEPAEQHLHKMPAACDIIDCFRLFDILVVK